MAILINEIVGHEEQKQSLLSRLQQRELPSTLIFSGPSGVGKAKLVHALLQVANCQNAELACGHCSSCLRSLEERNEMIYELKPEGKKVIAVDQVRELQQSLALKVMTDVRFVLIDPADRLSTAAANALLKVLEEPPPRTHFFLVTDRVLSLLPTIRSRSHIYKFAKLSAEDLRQGQEFSDFAIQWSDGRFAMAEQMNEEASIEQVNRSLKFLYGLLCEGPQDWKKHSPWFFNNEVDRELGLQIWDQALQKRLHATGENLDWLPEDSAGISIVYERTQDLVRDINANVDKILAVENFYYSIHGANQ